MIENAAPVVAGAMNVSSPPPALPDIGSASDARGPITVVNLDILEQKARQLLSPQRMSYLGPAAAGWTYEQNKLAFSKFAILPKRLRGVDTASIDMRVKLLGIDLSLPIITAPVGNQGFFHIDAELPNVQGTSAAGTLFVASGASSKTMEEIAAASSGPKWWQIYLNKDMGLNKELCQRAKAAGYEAIVLTVDSSGPGRSDEYAYFNLPLPSAYYPCGNYDPTRGGRGSLPNQKPPQFRDIEFLANASGLPVIVKAVVRKCDAKKAVKHGAACVWVSNHGGRQIDGVPSTLSRLGAIVDAVGHKVPVILDSGIRRGRDVYTALALGASAVAIGRPCIWGLTVGGAPGVRGVYDFLSAELHDSMYLSGVRTIKRIDRTMLIKANKLS